MKLTNKTKYRTRDLKAFITWVSNEEHWTAAQRKRLKVEVVPSQMWHTGEAWKGSFFITIRLPGPDRLSKSRAASLIAHELLHLTNKVHHKWKTERWMRGSGRYGYRDSERIWAAANQLKLEVPEPKVKAKPTPMEKAEAGLENAQAKVAEWERKVRLAQNRVKKWKAKVRYFEGRVKKLDGQPAPKPRKAPKLSDNTLVRRAINKLITNEVRQHDRQAWEVYSMLRHPSMQASGLRGSWEEEWEGDFTPLKDARKIVLPGETMMCRGYSDDMFSGEFELVIPSREELLGQMKKAAQTGEG